MAQLTTVAAAVSLVGVAVLVALHWTARSGISGRGPLMADVEPAPLADSAFPLVFVEQFNAAGLPANAALAVARLRSKLRDALARFDEVDVALDPDWARPNVPTPARPIPRSAYRISASADDQADGTLTLSVRLYDANEGTIVWARVIQGIRVNDVSLENESNIVQRLAATIAQPYGVIYARELDKSSAGIGDPRSRCVIEAFEYYRTHDPTRRAHVRTCVDRVTTAHPTFAAGQVVLAFQGLLDYFHNSSDIGALENAMAAANRAIALDPESARAHQVLMNVLYARGDPKTALAIGKKAVSLNPCDMIVLTSYGIRLLWSGETDQAMTLLRRAAEYGPGQPQFVYFALFVGAYLQGDDSEAARYANLLASDSYAYGLAARAIAAKRTGHPELARHAVQRLVQLKPAWRDNAKQAIERYGVPAGIAERMASDLAAARLPASN